MIEQVHLFLLGDHVFRAALGNTGIAQLTQQAIDRYADVRGKLVDRDFTHIRSSLLGTLFEPRGARSHDQLPGTLFIHIVDLHQFIDRLFSEIFHSDHATRG